MPPNETLFLKNTNKIIKSGFYFFFILTKFFFQLLSQFFFKDILNGSFFQFQVWDFPGQLDFFDNAFDSDSIFGNFGALVFVVDAQVNYKQFYNTQKKKKKNFWI